MESKKSAKYYILIVVFTILFFICMAICFYRFRDLSRTRKIRSLSYRLEGIERDERMFGPDTIFSSLYFDRDYEEEFDGYWEFAEAYLSYINGRLAEDKTLYIEALETYLENEPEKERQKAVEGYLKELRAD